MTLDELCTQRVAVWGAGAEGLALTRLLLDRGVVPTLIDDEGSVGERVEAALGSRIAVRKPADLDWGSVDVVVRSPGVSRYRPELVAAAQAGAEVTTAMAMWLQDYRAAPVLAITGTKGKSTTSTLAASILQHQGLSVALAGNIGTPVTDLYGRSPADAYVVEVSSYQAADVGVSPRVCVLTSLVPDHLDWHGGEEAYYRDKLRLITAGPPGALAVNAGSPQAVARTAGHPGRVLFGPVGRVRVEASGTVTVDGVPMVDGRRLAVPGAHNLANLCGAVAGSMLLLGEPPEAAAVAAAVDGFGGLPSRCRTVGERHGVAFVDDALASNPFATIASVAAFPDRPLTLIVGGADRGTDPGDLLAALALRRPPPRVVVLADASDAASRVLRSAGSDLEVTVAPDLAGAVEQAVGSTPTGGVVLFSPAAPTPPGGGGYRERSRQFVSAAGFGETAEGGGSMSTSRGGEP